MRMRLKEPFFTGPKDYTFKAELEGQPALSLTVSVDTSRYFEIDEFPKSIPIGIYADYVGSTAVNSD